MTFLRVFSATFLILCVPQASYAQSQNVLNETVGVRTTTSQERAREIMGRNMFGVEEAIKHFRVNPSKAQLLALSKIPFSEQTLDVCKHTHVLVAVFPLSILEIRGRVPRKLHLFYDEQWYNRELFANDRDGVDWRLVRKTPIPNSIEMNWREQQALLAQNEEVPTARVMIYTVIGHFLATGERLFANVYVRCSDLASGGYRVDVGGFDSDGLSVNCYWDDSRDNLGVSSARKFD